MAVADHDPPRVERPDRLQSLVGSRGDERVERGCGGARIAAVGMLGIVEDLVLRPARPCRATHLDHPVQDPAVAGRADAPVELELEVGERLPGDEVDAWARQGMQLARLDGPAVRERFLAVASQRGRRAAIEQVDPGVLHGRDLRWRGAGRRRVRDANAARHQYRCREHRCREHRRASRPWRRGTGRLLHVAHGPSNAPIGALGALHPGSMIAP